MSQRIIKVAGHIKSFTTFQTRVVFKLDIFYTLKLFGLTNWCLTNEMGNSEYSFSLKRIPLQAVASFLKASIHISSKYFLYKHLLYIW